MPSSFRQGDVLLKAKMYVVGEDADVAEKQNKGAIEFLMGDWIVVSNSCDLEQGRARFVLLAAVVPLKEVLKGQTEKEFNEVAELVRRGMRPALFMLAECEQVGLSRSVVNFREIVSVPHAIVRRAASSVGVVRMNPPFREKLGQAMADYLGSVGIEAEDQVTPFLPKTFHPAQQLRGADKLDEG
jgi:hypothetical protein